MKLNVKEITESVANGSNERMNHAVQVLQIVRGCPGKWDTRESIRKFLDENKLDIVDILRASA